MQDKIYTTAIGEMLYRNFQCYMNVTDTLEHSLINFEVYVLKQQYDNYNIRIVFNLKPWEHNEAYLTNTEKEALIAICKEVNENAYNYLKSLFDNIIQEYKDQDKEVVYINTTLQTLKEFVIINQLEK